MMDDTQLKIWQALCELDGETVAQLFTDWYGTQLLTSDFAGFLVDEGYLEECEVYDEEFDLVPF